MTSGRIAVAMSGGVDSAVAAALLVREGCEVIGLSMHLWDNLAWDAVRPEGRKRGCCSTDDLSDARRVADALEIPHYVVNFRRQFQSDVIDYFVSEYGRGRTPNPCAVCNSEIKFDYLARKAAELGADRLATGHYARVRQAGPRGRFALYRGADGQRDQSYFLFGLTQQQLGRTLFPIGDLRKEDIRAEARSIGLPVAEKSESREICFIPEGTVREFIEKVGEKVGEKPGDNGAASRGVIVDSEGQVLGEHSGVHGFTVGQRRGIGIASSAPYYVTAIDAERKRVLVGRRAELLRKGVHAEGLNLISGGDFADGLRVGAQIRYRHAPAPARLYHAGPEGGAARVEVCFEEPQRAPAPGQAVVFYEGDLVLGGAWIC